MRKLTQSQRSGADKTTNSESRVNVSVPDAKFAATDKLTLLDRRQAPSASVINKVTDFSGVTVDETLNQSMAKAISDQQLNLVSSTIKAGLKNHFYDLSAYSDGVLANVREGGLKHDLSRALYDASMSATDTTTSPTSVTGATKPQQNAMFQDAGGIGGHWDIARSWARDLLVKNIGSTPVIPAVQPHRESNQSSSAVAQHGFGPIISRWGVEFWAGMQPAGNPLLKRYKVQFGIRPVLQLTNPYNVPLPPTNYCLSFNMGHDGTSGMRWRVNTAAGLKDIAYPWDALLNLSGANLALLNGLQDPGNKPWLHFKTSAEAIGPGETVVFTPPGGNWMTLVTATDYNQLTRGTNTGGGVLAFYIPDGLGKVSVPELDDPLAKVAADFTTTPPKLGGFMFGENKGPNWDSPGGRNWVAHLTVCDDRLPMDLLNNMSEPLSRIERVGNGKWRADTAQFSAEKAKTLAETNDTTGVRVRTYDSYLGDDTLNYASENNRNIPWARDFNPRFHFPSMPNGMPCANGVLNGDPWRRHNAWGIRYGHGGSWWSEISPMETGVNTGSVFWGNGTSPLLGQARIVLFELPVGEILSPGELQHVNLGGRDRPLQANNLMYHIFDEPRPDNQKQYVPKTGKFAEAGTIQPTYIIGNSYCDPAAALADVTYDWSYRANEEIWDRWFVSGIPPATTGSGGGLSKSQLESGDLRNPRMQPIQRTGGQALEAINHIDRAASNLLVGGMFNMNSTSVEAWKALLGSTANGTSPVILPGTTQLTFDPTNTEPSARYARNLISNQVVGAPTSVGDSRWSSAIKLTDGQLNDLAKGVVQRIKQRKRPFASLSEFINRPAGQEMGLLQETFDQSALPTGTPGGTNLCGDGRLNNDFLGDFSADTMYNKKLEPGGAPGALRQGDFLQAVGSFINVRSDTFRIRAYGEKRDGLVVSAKAYCEVIVQRVPQFVDPSDPPEKAVATVTPANTLFGRRFVIKSFRWLNSNEI